MPAPACPYNPFPGLRPFELRDRPVFFGRERQTAELLDRLQARRFLAVVGTSGSGKSSLVRAGLLPALHGGLMARAGPNWQIAVTRPGGDPVGSLATALLETGCFTAAADPHELLRATLNRSALGLIEAVQLSQLPPGYNLLLVVDQFEEIFRFRDRHRTLPEEAGGYVQLLLEATRQTRVPIHVVLTLRSDFLGDCAQFSGLAEAINQGEYLVPRMKRDEYRLAIEGPVRVGGGAISGRLVQRLLNDLGDNPDQLPILQHALMRTWDRWEADHAEGEPMDLRHYETVGTMTSALSLHADEVYDALPDDRARELAARVFKALTETTSDRRGVRRPTRLKELGEIVQTESMELTAVLNAFRTPGRTFLMPPWPRHTTDAAEARPDLPHDHAAPNGRGTPEPAASQNQPDGLGPVTVIDLSHESLMRVWTRLQTWVAEEADSASTYRRLAESAELWQQARAGLYQDPELELALNWRRESAPNRAWGLRYRDGFETAMAFLERSEQARETARRKTLQQRRVLVTTIAAVALVFFFLWRYAVGQERLARSQARAIQAEQKAGTGDPRRSQDPRGALLLAKLAHELAATPLTTAVLRNMTFLSRLEHDALGPNPPALNQASWSPDGTRILTACSTNAYLWDARVGHGLPIRVLSGHSDSNRVATFSPDGSLALTAGWDGKAILWDATTWQPIHSLTGHLASISRAAFSRDGRHVLTASRDGTARVWDGASGHEVGRLPNGTGQSNEVWSAAFHPDGDRVALGDLGGGISVWEWRTTNRLARAQAHAEILLDLEFSCEGFLASACFNGTVTVWKGSTNGLQAIRGNSSDGRPVHKVAFSPDGRLLATAGDNRVATIWEWRSGTPILETPLFVFQHPQAVTSVEFSQDGHHLLTACADGYARVWETVVRALPDFPAPARVTWARSDPSGRLFVLGDGSNLAHIWSQSAHRIVTNLTAGPKKLRTAAFQPATNLLATAGDDGVLRLWDTTTWDLALLLTNYWSPQDPSRTTAMRELAFSPDGTYLVSTAYGRADVWSMTARAKVRSLTNHTDWVTAAVFSADGRWLATTSEDYSARVWVTRSWTLRGDLPHEANVYCAAFDPGDSTRLATGDKDLRFWRWDARSSGWRPDGILHSYGANLTSLQFMPGGECLLVTTLAGQIHLWDTAARRLIAELPGRSAGATPVALFSPDGREVFAFTDLALVYSSPAWAPRKALLEDMAQRRLRPLTPAEMQF